MCVFLCISGVAALVLQAATSKGTGKGNKHIERVCTCLTLTLTHTHTVCLAQKQQTIMEALSSSRDSEGQRVSAASGVKHLPR